VGGLRLRELPQISGSPIIFLQRLGLYSDFKFGAQLGFARGHHQILVEESVCSPGLRKLPENRGFPFNISATAEASDQRARETVDLLTPDYFFMLWPPNSPNLNPVNYKVWSVMQTVYKQGRSRTSTNCDRVRIS